MHILFMKEVLDIMLWQLELPISCVKNTSKCKGKGKAIPVTGRGGPQGCETSRLPHFL
jgi:hypothetical protein